MKLSTRARYALRMMVEITQLTNGDDEAISLARISEESGISRRYLEQLAITLKNNSLVRGKTGKGGGYRLARDPSEITVAEIIEGSIGPINIVDCVLEPDACDRSPQCVCRPLYSEINDRIIESLRGLTLEKLIESNGTL